MNIMMKKAQCQLGGSKFKCIENSFQLIFFWVGRGCTGKGGDEQDFLNFMVVPDRDEEQHCFEAFYDVTSNDALVLKTCPVCAGEKMKKDRDETYFLSDSSVTELLACLSEGRGNERQVVVL